MFFMKLPSPSNYFLEPFLALCNSYRSLLQKTQSLLQKKRNYIKKFCLFKKKNKVFLCFPVSSKLLSPSLHLVFKRSISIMKGGFMRKKPTNSTKLHQHPQVVAIFTRAKRMNFFEKFQGLMRKLPRNFPSLQSFTQKHMPLSLLEVFPWRQPLNLSVGLLPLLLDYLGAEMKNHLDGMSRKTSSKKMNILQKIKMELEGKSYPTLGMRLVTKSSNKFPVRGAITQSMATILESFVS